MAVYEEFCFPGRERPAFIHLAMRILSISANSASCERLFSMFGNILTKLRNRLGTENMNMPCRTQNAYLWMNTPTKRRKSDSNEYFRSVLIAEQATANTRSASSKHWCYAIESSATSHRILIHASPCLLTKPPIVQGNRRHLKMKTQPKVLPARVPQGIVTRSDLLQNGNGVG